jgi:predicted small integral membrane protein
MDLADGDLLRHHRAAAGRHDGLGIRLAGRRAAARVLGLDTTRGDRLFISLLGSAFIHLAWLGLVGPNLWWALGLSIVYAVAVFRWV